MVELLALFVDRIATPIGELAVVADSAGRLRAMDWTEQDAGMRRLLRLHYGENCFSLTPAANPGGLSAAIGAYFAGDLLAIDGLPVATGGTEFQRTVSRALPRIPFRQTLAYPALA